MSKNNIEFDDNKLGTSYSESLINTDSSGKDSSWLAWEEKSGASVLKFIKQQLASSVSNFEFDTSTSKLFGLNSFGDTVCSAEVTNAEPQYGYTFEIKSVYVNGLKHTEGTQISYSDNLKIEVGFDFKFWYTIINTPNTISIGQTFLFFTDKAETFEVKNIMPQNKDVTEELKVDISKFFKEIPSENLTNMKLGVQWIPTEPKVATLTREYQYPLNIIKINLKYVNDTVVNQTVTFDVEGLPSDLSGYLLEYFDYSIENALNLTTSGIYTSPLTLTVNSQKVTIDVGEGVRSILARVSHTSLQLASDWILINIINTGGSYNGHALIVAQNITNVLNNCNTDKLYDVQVVPGAGGSASVKCYISDNTTNFTKLHKENIFSGLSATDLNSKHSVYSYNEFATVSSTQRKNISIVLEINGINYTLMQLRYSNGKISALKYFQLSVIQNAYNIGNRFNTSSGAVLDFSLITSTDNQVFVKENIDDNLIQSDGYQLDGMRLMYKVSALYQNLSEGLFKNPIDLSRLQNLNNFTIDLMYASEYASDEQPNFSIGNLYFGPGYMYINGDEETKQDSKVSFEKDEVTHLIITYAANYKPNTYLNVYKDFFTNYDKINNNYNVLKIYVNGCINREILLVDSKDLGDFKFLIHPISSNLKMYLFKTYERTLTYAEIQKNTISALTTASDKLTYFNNNDILKDDLDNKDNPTISFWKTYNKHNVLVHVLPHGSVPMWYGNKDLEIKGSSLLIHYHNPDYAKYNGRLVGTTPQKMVYKNQGSSAKKYMFHNTSVSKFAFLSEKEIESNSNDRSVDYYYMPGDDKIRVKKIVGKVNYASSMQAHKPGSCNTYQDTYIDTFKEAASTKMYTGGRKSVYELPYFYFYYIVDEGVDPETIKITDLFEEKTDILGNKYAEEKDVKFFGFQTWGSAKGDKETYGYDGKKTPEYILLEGADNGNLMPNFKNPWGALQATEGNALKDITRNDRFTGLVIDKATIQYAGDQTNTDPWDIEFGKNDAEDGFLDSAKVSVEVFADMVDHIYLYDYLNLRGITEEEISPDLDIKYRYYITERGSNYRQFDVIRFDQATQQWVPGGLTRSGGKWDRFNLINFINGLSSMQNDDVINVLRANDSFIFSEHIDSGESDPNEVMRVVFRVFPELFKAAVEYYFDYEDLLFHQAFIKVICGTDNRAKNTYYQIIGKIYEENSEGKFVRTDKGDYKIRLLVDDMDTIFATNNNGQQVIPSHTLEPVFSSKYETVWNDLHNALLYTCDLLYEDQIFSYVENIISYLIGGNISVKNQETNLYKQYFSIQTNYPNIAYNHHAEIYYDVANLMYYKGLIVTEANAKSSLTGFVNNGVEKPLSLSHGRCVESEYQYTTERLTMLGSLCNKPQARGLYGDSLLINNSSGGASYPMEIKGEVDSNSYISLVANANGTDNYQRVASYPLGDILETAKEYYGEQSIEQMLYNYYDLHNDLIRSINYLMTPTSKLANFSVTGTSNIPQSILGTDKYRNITINSGLQYLTSFVKFLRAESLSIDGNTSGYSCGDAGTIKISNYLYLIQRLSLTNVNFTGQNVILDFRNCNKLVSIDLSGCTGIKGVIIPSNKYIESIKLPQNLEILELGYCQNDRFVIELPNSNLKTLTLDGRNTTEFINKFIMTYVTSTNINLIINNSETITLTNLVLVKLSQMPTIAFLGVKNIITDKMDFLLKLAIYYNSAFNGVTISGYPTIKYTTVYFGLNPCTIPQGSSKNYLQYLDFTDSDGNSANDVDISKLKFVLSNSDGIKFDTVDPLLIVVSKSVQDGTSVTLTIKYNNSTVKTVDLKVGFYAPQIGDFAYDDGTFSPIYSEKAIGYVYKSEQIGLTGNSYYVSIMALNPLDDTVLGFSESRNSTTDSTLLELLQTFTPQKKPNSSFQKLKDLLPVSVNPLVGVNNSNCMSDLISTSLLNNYDDSKPNNNNDWPDLEKQERDLMKNVLISAVYIHNTLCATSGIGTSLIDRFNTYSGGSYDLRFKQDLLKGIDDFLRNLTFTLTNGSGTSLYTVNAYSSLLPGYVKAYTYYPKSCSENSTHKVVRKYLDEPWKIPSTHTVANLVINIMKSLAVNGGSSINWQSTNIGASGNGLYSTILKNNPNMIYNGEPKVHEYLRFLGSEPKLCSEFAGNDDVWVNYSYHTYTDSYGTLYSTFNVDTSSGYWTDNKYGVRNLPFGNIFPCITITLEKSDYDNN